MRALTMMSLAMLPGIASPVGAQSGDKQSTGTGRPAAIEELSRCRTMADVAARLACFDAAAAQLTADVDEQRITVLNREDVRRTRRSLFGFTLPSVNVFGKADGREEFTEIDSVITRILPLPNQRYELVLIDGARWQTTEPTRWRPERAAKVRIRKAALGSFWIAVERMPAIRGRRVG